MEEIINACLDGYDERTFDYEELAGGELVLPASMLLETGFRQNQQADGYKMGCTVYSGAERSNYLTKGRLLGATFIKRVGTRDAVSGDYIINPIKQLLKEGIISGYAQVNTLEAVKKSLANNRPVVTGSSKLVWSTARHSPYIIKKGVGTGHRVHIIGYNDDTKLLTLKNSYGPDYMCKGNFFLKYEDFDALMNTKLSLIENKTLVDNYKQKIMENIKLDSAKIAFLLGLYNGKDGTANREEIRAMLERAIEGILNGKITKETIEKAKKEILSK